MQPENLAQFEKDLDQIEKGLDQLEGELDDDHMHEAAIVLKYEVNGQPDVDGRTDVMSIRFTYVDTQDDPRGRNLKQIKFCIHKGEAEEFAALLHRGATTERTASRRRPCSSNRCPK